MKRRINIEQLAELTGEQVRKLHDWWQPSIGDWMINTNLVKPEPRVLKYTFKHERDLPLLDIGQMIELLNPNEMEQYYIGKNGKDVLRLKINDEQIYEADNLCDALFEAVKQVLGV